MTATAMINNVPAGFWIPVGVIDSPLLDYAEKLTYTAIKRHFNSKSKTAWPGLRRLSRETGCATKTVQKAIRGLEDKGILSVERAKDEKGANKTNIYRFTDTVATWEAETLEEMRAAAYKQPETVEDVWSQAVNLLKMLNVPQAVIDTVYQCSTAKKEKGLPEMPVSESPENHMYSKNYNLQEQDTAQQAGNQADCEESPEEISISDLKEAIGYDAEAVPEMDRFLYDVAVLALSDALKGPTRAVDRQGLELLRHDDLLEAIDRMKGQKGVKNPRRYLKQVLLNMVQEKKLEAQKPIQGRKSPAGTFGNFTEREYDFAELERKLLLSQDDYNS